MKKLSITLTLALLASISYAVDEQWFSVDGEMHVVKTYTEKEIKQIIEENRKAFVQKQEEDRKENERIEVIYTNSIYYKKEKKRIEEWVNSDDPRAKACRAKIEAFRKRMAGQNTNVVEKPLCEK